MPLWVTVTSVPPATATKVTSTSESYASEGKSAVRQVMRMALPVSSPTSIPSTDPSFVVCRPPTRGSKVDLDPVKAVCFRSSSQVA